ncbi:MAG: response regulator [Anaerolineae bacterium]|nr:response regulator [Anaerolineae bacterium]
MAKILLIDDDSEFLDMLNLLMRRSGHQTILSADGPDGLVKAKADPPDLAIVDVMMPDMTGYEVVRKLRADPSTASLPIIILTARGQPVDRQAALDAGADEYMSKPVTMAELAERVEELLGKPVSARPTLLKGAFVMLSLRGGVGVTTLAANLAVMLAQAGDRAACLLDLCSSSGHAALQLGLRPEPNWSDLVGVGGIDAGAVDAHLLQHGSGLQVLASPVFPVVGPQGVSRPIAQAMLRALQQEFSIVVVDAPSVLDEAAMAAVEMALAVVLVVTVESPSIQTALGTLRALKRWLPKCYTVINQVSPGAQLPAEAIERTLKRPVIGMIPFDPAQAQALAQGAPQAVRDPASPLAQGVQQLAQNLVQVVGKSLAGS